jgi:stage IV sporulation protein FB
MRFGKIYISGGFVLTLSALYFLESYKFILTLLIAAFVHELGHLLTIRLLGGKVKLIRLECSGALIVYDGRNLSYLYEILCALSGPTASILLAFTASWLNFDLLAGTSMLLGCFNLIPAPALDGGRAVYALAAHYFSAGAAERAVCVSGCISALSVLSFALSIALCGRIFLLPLFCGILLFATVVNPRVYGIISG